MLISLNKLPQSDQDWERGVHIFITDIKYSRKVVVNNPSSSWLSIRLESLDRFA